MAKGDRIYYKALQLASSDQIECDEVLKLLLRAVELGNGPATYALATWYLHGKCVKKDLNKGIELLKIASSKGVAEAYFDLAISYEKRLGTKKDLNRAYQCYLLAALLGDKNSIYEVGRCIYYGIGTQANHDFGYEVIDSYPEYSVDPDQ